MIHLKGKYVPASAHERHGCFKPFSLYLAYARYSYWAMQKPETIVDAFTKEGLIDSVRFPDGELRWRWKTGTGEISKARGEAVLKKWVSLKVEPGWFTNAFSCLKRLDHGNKPAPNKT